MDEYRTLREKLEKLIPPKEETSKPSIRGWIAERKSDGLIKIDVSENLKGKEFVLVEDIVKYIEWLEQR